MKKTILIIDDDPVVQWTTSAKLKEAGYDVLVAGETPAALIAINTYKPDIILLDLSFPPDVPNGGMPSWDGLSLMHWVQGFEAGQHAKFIIITGRDPATLTSNTLAREAIAIFQKPINHPALLAAIEGELRPKLGA